MQLTLIPPGEFTMGSPTTEAERQDFETPHRVTLTRPFYLGTYEVTQAEYQTIMGENPSWFSASGKGKDKVAGKKTDRFPVEFTNWEDAQRFCRKLSDREGKTYRLPTEHARMLTREGDGGNMSVPAQIVGLLGNVESDIIDCFRKGGGVPYEKFDRFHEVMMEDSGQTVLPALIDHILPLGGDIVERLESGIRALDVGCGRGRALTMLAEAFPNSRFVGYDLSREAIDFANSEAARRGLTNITFEIRDATDFDRTADPDAFDLVTTFDAIHDQAKPLAVLRGIRRTLKDDGVYICQDIKGSCHHHGNMDNLLAPFLYTVSTMHCMTVSLAQGGEGLGTMWGCETAMAYFAEAGFSKVTQNDLEHDIMNVYYVCRP